MKKTLLLFSLFSSLVYGLDLPTTLPFEYGFERNEPQEVVVNNRILCKIGGKALTVMDVVKKMDLLFHQRFPQLASSAPARYQFYCTNWESMLRVCLDDQLILADAAEKKIEVTDGDVREEMEKLLGPDVVLNIEKMGLKFDEVFTMIKTELTVRKVTNMLVKIRAIKDVTPKTVREAYEELVAKNPPSPIWRYQVLSIRSGKEEKNLQVAEIAKQLLKEQTPFENLTASLEKEGIIDDSIQLKISDVFERKEKELSVAHKAILQTLNIGTETTSYIQTTKKEETVLTQLFYLLSHEIGTCAPLADVEEKLQNELIQAQVEKYSSEYLDKLYKRFGFKEDYLAKMLPANFVPFSLRS